MKNHMNVLPASIIAAGTMLSAVLMPAAAAADTATGAMTSWFSESASALTSACWSPVPETENGNISLLGDYTYTPSTSCGGDKVAVNLTVTFPEAVPASSTATPANAKAALRLGTEGSTPVFQALSYENNAAVWKTVAADGVTPAVETAYMFRLDFNSSANTYTVTLIDGTTEKLLASGTQTVFNFAAGATGRPSSVEFQGEGLLSSFTGSYGPLPAEYFEVSIGSGTTSVNVPVSWIEDENIAGVDAYSSAAAAQSALEANGANGIPVWQSYCLGLSPASAASVILCEPVDAAASSTGTFAVNVKNLNLPANLSGVTVTAILERKVGSNWETAATATVQSGGTVLSASLSEGKTSEIFRVRITIQ